MTRLADGFVHCASLQTQHSPRLSLSRPCCLNRFNNSWRDGDEVREARGCYPSHWIIGISEADSDSMADLTEVVRSDGSRHSRNRHFTEHDPIDY